MLARQQQYDFCLKDRQRVNVLSLLFIIFTFHSTFTAECPELSRSGRAVQLICERSYSLGSFFGDFL